MNVKLFLQAVVSLVILGLIVVGPFTLVYFASRVSTAFSQEKGEQDKVKEQGKEESQLEKSKKAVEKTEAESTLPPFVQKQHDWFLTENMDAGQWAREFGWGTGCYCQGVAKCIDVEGRVAGHPHFFWYAWSNSDGLITVTLNILLTVEQKEAVAKIQAPIGSWTTGGKTATPDVTQDQFGTEVSTYIETDNTWTERFCTLEGESTKCNEMAALERVLRRLEELSFFDSLVMGIRVFSQKGE